MKAQSAWTERRIIESFDVDRFARLRPQALFAILLNGAWNAARGSVYGYEELAARNLMWVLVRLHLRILRTPRWGEEIRLETWGKRVQRFYALRDFALSLPGSEKAASATTVWMVIDKERGRPQRLDPAADGFPWEPSREEMETSLEKVPALQDGREAGRRAVHFSDIDVNQHVNATRYLQWMLDGQDPQVLEHSEPEEIQVSFLAEALLGDEVVVRRGEAEPRQGARLPAAQPLPPIQPQLVSITRAADGRELCRGSFLWRSREGGPA